MARFVFDLVGNHKDMFSCGVAQISGVLNRLRACQTVTTWGYDFERVINSPHRS